MSHEESLAAYTGAFVDELVRSGIGHVVICPGSRSTPLAVSLAAHTGMKHWMHVDERSAAFFALGMAKARREPVAILCSSGTAAANFFPAVVEAHEARVPLLVLTADRPHELRDVGAPQAIDQVQLYGDYTKWFVEMALPESTTEILRYVRMTAGRAAATALTTPSGPVHLNFPFREPLVPAPLTDPWPGGRADNQRYVDVDQGVGTPDAAKTEKLAAELMASERGLLVCGPQQDPELPSALVRLAEKLHYPIIADPLSGLRSGRHDKTWVLDGYDAFLRDESIQHDYVPDVIVRFGAMPVSKAFLLYVKKHPQCRQIVVDRGGWREPTQLASDRIDADPVAFCEALLTNPGLDGKKDLRSNQHPADVQQNERRWEKAWLHLNRVTEQQVIAREKRETLSEGRVFRELSNDCLPPGTVLFVGNSMPVRDLDTFFMNNEQDMCTMANRGANGIDGVTSTALGASSTGASLVLVVGDLSFYHDLNGLLAAKWYHLNVTIVLINNNGGGIFSFLPQADQSANFEPLFGTPTDLDFRKAVEMYGGSFHVAADWPDFRSQVQQGAAVDGLNVIEVQTTREQNSRDHRMLWQRVSEAIHGLEAL